MTWEDWYQVLVLGFVIASVIFFFWNARSGP